MRYHDSLGSVFEAVTMTTEISINYLAMLPLQ